MGMKEPGRETRAAAGLEVARQSAPVVQPTGRAAVRLRPLAAGELRLRDGFWADRLRLNREKVLPHGYEQLEQAGNLHNFRLAAGLETGRYRALGIMFDQPFPFLDSDVYKWLEGCAWELDRLPDEGLAAAADRVISLVEGAQRGDGYLNTFVQVLAPGREYADLQWGHELYCYGHLLQAGLAWQRALGDDRLLQVGLRAVASVQRALGPTGREGIDGHPEIEMALVELYRTTGDRRHLDLAARFIDLRGRGLLGEGRFGRAYWQDHQPVREAAQVAGHAVRQLYLDCAAVDLAVELGDSDLLEAVVRRWHDMLATRSYLTGGLGSRHKDEAFGDPYELPPDVAYNETCAAIASVMLAWRLLLATGDARAADVIERTIYNGVLPGLSLSGTEFFYVNPLQRRTHRAAAEGGHDMRSLGGRAAWYACACCPPNLMRLLGAWEQYLATADEAGIQLHQYASADISAQFAGGTVRLSTTTDYPWAGDIRLEVHESPAAPWTLGLRIPDWCTSAVGTVAGQDVPIDGPQLRLERAWQAGDVVRLRLDMPARTTWPYRRIDAVRGCLALERGPLVYCLESADLPAGVELEQVVLPASVSGQDERRPDLDGALVGLRLDGRKRADGRAAWPYGRRAPAGAAESLELHAIPYFAWANRAVGAMRVWIPADE